MPICSSGILIIAPLAIAAYHVLAGSSGNRTLIRDEQGHLIAIGEREHSVGRLGGQGKGENPPLHLKAGRYRIRYEFDSLTRLALIDTSGDETLIITSAPAKPSSQIGAAGGYRFLIEPSDESAAWTIHYRQIT